MSEENFIKAEPTEIIESIFRQTYDPIIRLVLTFNTPLSISLLQTAIQKSLKEAPLLNCRYDFKKNHWVPLFNKEKDIFFVKANCSLKKELASNILESVSPEIGPQIKIFYLEEGQKCALIFIVSHLAMDGLSLKRYAYLIARVYRNLEKSPSYQEKPFVLDRSFEQIFSNIKQKNKQTLSLKAHPYPHLPFSNGEAKSNFFVKSDLSSSLFSKILVIAKNQGATANDIIMTSYGFALSKASGEDHVSFPCPVSFLPFAKGGEQAAFMNLTGVYWFDQNGFSQKSFSQILQETSASFCQQKESLSAVAGPRALLKVSHYLPTRLALGLLQRIVHPATVSYTNIGIIDENEISFGKIVPEEVYFVTAVKMAPMFQLSISTYRGVLTLTSAFFGTQKDKALIVSLHKETIKEMNLILGA